VSACAGFMWVGQSFKYCERCSQPYWEHTHDSWRGELTPITREQAETVRARYGTEAPD
jgi:acyl-CoA thioesterase FadM